MKLDEGRRSSSCSVSCCSWRLLPVVVVVVVVVLELEPEPEPELVVVTFVVDVAVEADDVDLYSSFVLSK